MRRKDSDAKNMEAPDDISKILAQAQTALSEDVSTDSPAVMENSPSLDDAYIDSTSRERAKTKEKEGKDWVKSLWKLDSRYIVARVEAMYARDVERYLAEKDIWHFIMQYMAAKNSRISTGRSFFDPTLPEPLPGKKSPFLYKLSRLNIGDIGREIEAMQYREDLLCLPERDIWQLILYFRDWLRLNPEEFVQQQTSKQTEIEAAETATAGFNRDLLETEVKDILAIVKSGQAELDDNLSSLDESLTKLSSINDDLAEWAHLESEVSEVLAMLKSHLGELETFMDNVQSALLEVSSLFLDE